jgi:hypothetical protein
MGKLEITVVVPERIAALVQDYLQNWILVGGNSGFMSHLLINEVETPEQFLCEMEIGIKHPDDEPTKIKDFLESEHKEVLKLLQEYIEPTYIDSEIGEHLYSIDCISENVFWPPIEVVEFVQSVKATDCSYFRFVK